MFNRDLLPTSFVINVQCLQASLRAWSLATRALDTSQFSLSLSSFSTLQNYFVLPCYSVKYSYKNDSKNYFSKSQTTFTLPLACWISLCMSIQHFELCSKQNTCLPHQKIFLFLFCSIDVTMTSKLPPPLIVFLSYQVWPFVNPGCKNINFTQWCIKYNIILALRYLYSLLPLLFGNFDRISAS